MFDWCILFWRAAGNRATGNGQRAMSDGQRAIGLRAICSRVNEPRADGLRAMGNFHNG